jgi:hypothetical protein
MYVDSKQQWDQRFDVRTCQQERMNLDVCYSTEAYIVERLKLRNAYSIKAHAGDRLKAGSVDACQYVPIMLPREP